MDQNVLTGMLPNEIIMMILSFRPTAHGVRESELRRKVADRYVRYTRDLQYLCIYMGRQFPFLRHEGFQIAADPKYLIVGFPKKKKCGHALVRAFYNECNEPISHSMRKNTHFVTSLPSYFHHYEEYDPEEEARLWTKCEEMVLNMTDIKTDPTGYCKRLDIEWYYFNK